MNAPRWLLGVFCLLVMPITACAADCTQDMIRSVSKSGAIVTSSGHLFQVLGQDFIDYTKWGPNEQVTVCEKSSADQAPVYHLTNAARKETLVVVKRPR